MRFRPNVPVMVAAAAAPARTAAPAGARIALTVADGFVIPAYRALAQETQRQVNTWNYFAEDRFRNNFATLRSAYSSVCDAWAAAQIVKMGPMSLFLRYERFAYWPEARNVTLRTLDALLASQNPRDLLPETLVSNSVAAQGLTALERLLYDGTDPSYPLRAPGAAGDWRVQVGLGIARNLNTIASDVLSEWTAPDGVRAAIAANRGWNNLFAGGAEAARLLLTDLVGAFRMMHDVKLLPVLGDDVASAMPRLSESWRSQRAKRNLSLNLTAAKDMAREFARNVPASGQARMAELGRQFTAAEAAMNAVPADMGEAAADPARRPRVEAARDAIKATQVLVAEALPPELGITLGFNALDGD